MGGMSASDAAPLPRLGEVFFDVRGNSRSMRLSWYADTGVAVLSIWQGGMCTGTFRLSIADLPRMVETLQHGPGGQRREWDPEVPGEVFAQVPRVATGQGQAMEPLSDQRGLDRGSEQAEYRARSAQYQTAQHQATQYQTAQHEAVQYQTAQHEAAQHEAGRYLTESGAPRTRTAGYPAGPPGHRAVPPGPQTVAPEYLAELPELPDDPRTGATPRLPAPPEYLPAPPGQRAAPPGRPATPPGHRAAPPGRPATPSAPEAGYLDLLTGSADPLTGSLDPLTAPPDPLTRPAGYQAQPPDQRTEYLADLPGTGPTGPAGYDSALGAGGPVPSGAGYPPADASGSYPRGTGREVLADDPYLGGTGPVDYPDSHYPPGTSAPGHGDVPGQGTADYPAHSGSAVTDDIVPGPGRDSTSYDRPQGRRRAASRHAAPDEPSD